MISPSLVRYVLTAALRDRLYLAIILAIAVGASLSLFIGSAAVIESSAFVVVFCAAGLRFVAVAGLVLFVSFYIRRSFESRDAELLLSRPVSRFSFLLSHAAAFSVLAAVTALMVGTALFLMAPHKPTPGLFLWGSSMAVELVIMANAALFFAMVLGSAVAAALASGGLYVLARMIGDLLGIAQAYSAEGGSGILTQILQVISMVVPRLDLMAQSSWLVYGPEDSIGFLFLLVQLVLYSALLIGAALVDLTRRQF